MLSGEFGDPRLFLEFMKLGVGLLADRSGAFLPKSRTRPVVQAWLAPHLDSYKQDSRAKAEGAPFLRRAEIALCTGTVGFFAQSAAALIDSVGQALTQETPAKALLRTVEDIANSTVHLTAGGIRLVVHPSQNDYDNMLAATEIAWSVGAAYYTAKSAGNGMNQFKMPDLSPMPVTTDGVAMASTGFFAGERPNIFAGPLLMAADGSAPNAVDLLGEELEHLDRTTVGPSTEVGSHIVGPWKVRLEALHERLISFLGLRPDQAIVVEMGPGPQHRMIKTLAPRVRKYIAVEPQLYCAKALERLTSNLEWGDRLIVFGSELWDIPIRTFAEGGADIVYASHPHHATSNSWVGMGVAPHNPVKLIDALGEGVRDGGFLVIQTDDAAYAAAVTSGASRWRPVFVKQITEPFMPSIHFIETDHIIVLQRMAE
ncbi:MAG: hypothetical protein COV45_01400 [Deltaproteobacteria bacterium CG11_big_fil_rev_8_21_14_0_20_47_16]|nr:MAG: hypothetical protein COV45_01400 [Deltaproteobacteria bacterium CG11_big_fil_rev_8_21_14_0_20_47_16]